MLASSLASIGIKLEDPDLGYLHSSSPLPCAKVPWQVSCPGNVESKSSSRIKGIETTASSQTEERKNHLRCTKLLLSGVNEGGFLLESQKEQQWSRSTLLSTEITLIDNSCGACRVTSKVAALFQKRTAFTGGGDTWTLFFQGDIRGHCSLNSSGSLQKRVDATKPGGVQATVHADVPSPWVMPQYKFYRSRGLSQ